MFGFKKENATVEDIDRVRESLNASTEMLGRAALEIARIRAELDRLRAENGYLRGEMEDRRRDDFARSLNGGRGVDPPRSAPR